MKKSIILLLACFVLIAGVQNLHAQKTKNLMTPADSTGFLVKSLLTPSLQKTNSFRAPSNLAGYRRIQFSTHRKIAIPLIFKMSTMLTKLKLDDDSDSFEPFPNYIYSRNVFEYNFRLKRRKRYPENFRFYRVDNHSLFNLFD